MSGIWVSFASGVFLHAEYTHFAVDAAEGLESFEALLSIMQTRGCGMDRNHLVACGIGLFPYAILARRTNDIVRLGIVKCGLHNVVVNVIMQKSSRRSTCRQKPF